MTTAQLLISEEGSMRKTVKKSLTSKQRREPVEKLERVGLTTNQRRFLQVLETGTEVEEPSLLAGRP